MSKSAFRFIRFMAVVLGLMAASNSMAQSQTWDIVVSGADGNPSVYSDGQRSTSALIHIVDAGMQVQPGDRVNATFRDGWKQSYLVEGTPNNRQLTVIGNSLTGPIINASNDCVGGAAMSMYGHSAGSNGIPVYRATYECEGNMCTLLSAVLIGYTGGPPQYNATYTDLESCTANYSI